MTPVLVCFSTFKGVKNSTHALGVMQPTWVLKIVPASSVLLLIAGVKNSTYVWVLSALTGVKNSTHI